MKEHKERIVIVSPVRDEAEYIERTIRSIMRQTTRPVEWVIVDDGSSDGTRKIVERLSRGVDWIRLVRREDRGRRAVGPGVVEAFYYGYEHIRTRRYDYICKLDGDIELNPDYFATLLAKFAADPRLGAASGKPFLVTEDGRVIPERTSDEMVVGAVNFYRQSCFESIGGFVREVHWDGIAFHQCRRRGWRTCSFADPALAIYHNRMMGASEKSIFEGRLRWGRGQWFLGTHPLYLLGIGAYRALERPFVIGGALIVAGYIQAWWRGMRRYGDSDFRRSLHAWQMERLGLGRRLEPVSVPADMGGASL